ncbi:nucleoid-associated protein [Yersinia enterocolitica]|uniref:nucleoid-associated protein n=1 Tax=Yersinia enterocolitica TaxID=630 RepID=UPI0027F0E7DE|nr:nucleoid-associated protein [Yersinia enterocolitica]EKN5053369.1 nucleoid-associated protein [Yersinia enterocolitica]EKN5145843.1 nucleoid-associated protein [Yersinia enterocolitica]EKN6041459.1 nucleoid-associated protein [Yersinia enterocolitica]EKN6381731.1 nucleoid-associated protein [Yersinia enterocolitica]
MTGPIIKHVIVHELIKEVRQDFDFSKPFNLRKTTLDNSNHTVVKLIKEISDLYGSKGNSAHYGSFITDQTQQGPIPGQFSEYNDSTDCPQEIFVTLSNDVMQQIVNKAKAEPLSSGGFIVFCDYVSEGLRFFLVSMIKKKDGVTIGPTLEPEDMMHLDLSKINQAARINFHMYNQYLQANETERTDMNYLSFVSKGSGQSASAYFIAAIGCDKGLASAKATTQLPAEVKKFFMSKEELKDKAVKFRQEVIEYLQHQSDSNESAKLSDIETLATSHMTYVDPETRIALIEELMKHLNSEDIRIPVEFVVNKPSLKKIVNLIFKSPDINFSFEKELLGFTADDDVWYDEESGRLSFTRLPPEMRTKISQAAKENQKLRNQQEE